MRQSNQVQNYNSKVIKTPNARTNNTNQTQQRTYQKINNHPISNQKSTVYISGRIIQPSDLNKKTVISSTKKEQDGGKYNINQRGNQRYNQINTINQGGQRIERKIYVNQGKGNNQGLRIKPVTNNNINEKGGLSSLVSSTESIANTINASGNKGDNRNYGRNINKNDSRNNPKEKKVQIRENIRNRIIDKSEDNHSRAKSYLSERKENNLSLPKNMGKSHRSSSAEVKRKTIVRGGPYKNIQITHIYVSTKPNLDKYNFHIIENLSRVELEKKPLDLSNIKSRIKKNEKAKSTYKSSCDGRTITPLSREKIQKTTIFQHAAGMGMTSLEPNLITSNFYTSGLKKIPKMKKEKGKPVIEVVEVYRSQQPDNILNRSKNNSISITKYDTNNNFNKSYNFIRDKITNKSINTITPSINAHYSNNTNQKNVTNLYKPIIESKSSNNYNVNKNNNLASYYNNIPANKNKNYNNIYTSYTSYSNNNTITVNTRENNKDSIRSPYNINHSKQTNYNKDNNKESINSSYNISQTSFKQDNNRPLSRSDLSPISKPDVKTSYNTYVNRTNYLYKYRAKRE